MYIKLFFSLGISLVFIWGIGALLLTSPTVCVWDDELGIAIPQFGTQKQERGENWITATYGPRGLEAIDAWRSFQPGPKWLIFGDSYIEANMVAPEDRLQAQLTHLGHPAVGVGISGIGCVEYNHLMIIYNQVIPDVVGNILLIADISDILPPTGTTQFSDLKPSYSFRKIEGNRGKISYRFKMMAFRSLLKKLQALRTQGLDFKGNHWHRACVPEAVTAGDTSYYEEYWRQMLSALLSNAPNEKLMIVYAPTVPNICGNDVSMANADEAIMHRFSVVCQEFKLTGGGIVDLGPQFCEYTIRTQKFPRGFFNTRPGAGHLNRIGHRLAAEAIAEILEQ